MKLLLHKNDNLTVLVATKRRKPECAILEGSRSISELSAAAMPAACPIAIQVMEARTDPSASCVAEMQRPATSKPSIPFGSKQR